MYKPLTTYHLPLTKLCFLGAGNIAEAIIAGIINSDREYSKKIIATDIRPERLTYISNKFGIRVTTDNIKAITQSQTIIIAVKPQQITELLKEISNAVKPHQTVISVAAGISTSFIEKFLKKSPVIRTMPNTCALVRESTTVICKGKYAKPKDEKIALKLFATIGKTITLPEKFFDTITAVSGSGPAYVFYLTEAITNSAEKLGLEKSTAKEIAIQTVYGAAKLMKETGLEPEVLRSKVTSPGGTTEQAIRYFNSKHFKEIILDGIKRAKRRSEELAKTK